jgi:WD40 repeat protein/serine/threonine protein kinase
MPPSNRREPPGFEEEDPEHGGEGKLIPPPRGGGREDVSFLAHLQRRFGREIDPSISLQADESAPGEDAAAPRPDSSSGSNATEGLLFKLSEQDPRARRFRIKGELARGGMGAILRVWDDDLRRNLAMKVLLSRRGTDDLETQAGEVDTELLSRFLEEAQITGQLDHPGIVPVHDLGLDERGRVYFTMRLVRGRDLKGILDLLAQGAEGWTLTKALHVVLKVCEAMAFAHSKGVVHRDLKPANIMVGRFGETYVMDWGLARVLGRRDSHDLRLKPADASALSLVRTARQTDQAADEKSPLVTMDGDVIGTPSFMAPEQALGRLEEVGPRSDVYSLGSILYQILTGQAPYVKPDAKLSPHTVLLAAIDGPPARVERLDPSVPGELAAICNKAMARDVEARYPTMLEMAADIEAFLEGRVVSAYEAGPFAEARKWVHRNRGLAAAAALACLLAVGGVAGVIAVQISKAAELEHANQDLLTAKTRAEEKEGQAVAAQMAATRAASEAEAARIAASQSKNEAERKEAIANTRRYMSDIRAAEYTLRLRQVGETLGLLARCDADMRSWEWDHLSLRCQSQLGAPAHPTTPIAALRISPRGKVLLLMDNGRLSVYGVGAGGIAGAKPLQDALWLLGQPDRVDFDLDPRSEVAAVIGRGAGGVVLLSALGVDADPAPDPAALLEPYELVDGDGGRLPPQGVVVAEVAGAEPTRLAFGPTDDLLAVGYDNGIALVWDHAARDLLFALTPPAGESAPPEITALAWSPDGARLATTSSDGTLRVWNGATGALALEIHAHEGDALAVAFAPDGGDRIATGGEDGRVRLWRASDGLPIARHAGHSGPVRELAFRPDARALASGGDDTTLAVWDLGEASARLEAGGDAEAVLADSRELLTLLGHEGPVSGLAFSADGALLFSAGRDGSLRAWDPEYGGPTTELIDSRFTKPGADVRLAQVTAVDFHPNGWLCLTGHADGSIAIWDTLRGELQDILRGHRHAVTSARFGPDGNTILSASVDRWAILWNVAARSEEMRFQHAAQVNAAVLAPDRSFVVTAGSDRIAHVFNAATEEELYRLGEHDDWVNAVAVTPDSAEVWTASRDGKLRLWRVANGAKLGELDRGTEITSLALSADGKLLAAGLGDGRLAVLDIDAWRDPAGTTAGDPPWLFEIEAVGNGDPITALAFTHHSSADERARLVAGSIDGNLRIYHSRTGEHLMTLRGHAGSISGVCFSPDDARLLSGAAMLGHSESSVGPGESAARVWETGATGQRRIARREAAKVWRTADSILQGLFSNLFLQERVLNSLTAPSASLPMTSEVRQAAIRMARLRVDDGVRLAEESWRAVRAAGATLEVLATARQRAEAATGLAPDSAFCLAVLAATQVRSGVTEEALLSLARLDAGRGKNLDARTAAIRDAFAALADDRLGQADEARAAYDAFVANASSAEPEFASLADELAGRFAPLAPALDAPGVDPAGSE